ncbi:alpha/beta hydrolase [Flavobacteriaceae bacterium (ex Bugula neritina AB1)]|nr:alpha/beta hydrolase [Flavobacteriaceae bacterium (ex Bugula neritina AB1)]
MTLAYKGIKINYHVFGKGPALIFLHGFLENSSMWNDIIPHYMHTNTCVAIDLLGHGKTDCLGYIHTMEDMAHAVKAVLGHLSLKAYTLIGHSMGGYVSLACVELFPEEVTGLVLLNSTSFPDSEERKANRKRAIDIIKKNSKAYISMAIANLFAPKNRDTFIEQIEMIKKNGSKTSIQGIISALEGMKIRKDRTKVLSNFNMPKIIFAGKQDPVLGYEQSVDESKKLETEIISFDGGHMTYLENRDEFLKSLSYFLKRPIAM